MEEFTIPTIRIKTSLLTALAKYASSIPPGAKAGDRYTVAFQKPPGVDADPRRPPAKLEPNVRFQFEWDAKQQEWILILDAETAKFLS